MDPTITKICPCGKKVSVNQLGQHHHNDCEYDPVHPKCCNDPNVTRFFFARKNSGTYCKNCEEIWPGSDEAYLEGLASSLINDWQVDRKARPTIFYNNLRVINQLAN